MSYSSAHLLVEVEELPVELPEEKCLRSHQGITTLPIIGSEIFTSL